MIRSSSRKVKPTSKFEEFKLTSTGKKRGRPRKSVDTLSLHNDTAPNLNQLNQSMASMDHMSHSMSQIGTKQESQQLLQSQLSSTQQPDTLQQHSLSATPQHHLTRPKREPKTSISIAFDDNQNADRSHHNHHATSTPIREPKTTTKHISSRKEEMMRLREENMNMRAQLEQLRAEHEELKRQSSYTGLTVPKIDYDDLKERYQRDMTYAKRHEWCVVCLTQSRYHCCWNTTYCSQKCQVADWYARHGKSCERRKTLSKS